MFKLRIIYDETIENKKFPEPVVIMRINYGKSVGCLLYNQKIEDWITISVTNIVFQHIGLVWINKSNKILYFILKSTVLLGYLMAHGITL